MEGLTLAISPRYTFISCISEKNLQNEEKVKKVIISASHVMIGSLPGLRYTGVCLLLLFVSFFLNQHPEFGTQNGLDIYYND